MRVKKVSSDNRRTIWATNNLLEDNKEFSIIKLKKGKAIGGCVHIEDEYMGFISGSAYCLIGEDARTLKPGDTVLIKKELPHMVYAHEDSILCEWGVDKTKKENDKKDETMRNQVERINNAEL